VTEPFKWVTVAFPFGDMILTRRGRIELEQYPVEQDNVQGWGVLLADGSNGPFKFEVQSLRALREFKASDYNTVAMQMVEQGSWRGSGGEAQQQLQQQQRAGADAPPPAGGSASAAAAPEGEGGGGPAAHAGGPGAAAPAPTAVSQMTKEQAREYYERERDSARLR